MITIEEIDGQKMTVVWRDDPASMFWDDAYFIGVDELGCRSGFSEKGDLQYTAIPALPRKPEPEDARLLYRYMAEGIEVVYSYKDHCGEACAISAASNLDSLEWCVSKQYRIELKHAINSETGERVEIAIKENEDGKMEM